MSTNDKPLEEKITSHLQSKPAFVLFILGSILIAIVLVIISMALYQMSGTAQLDLSRPGYDAVRAKVQQKEKFDGFKAEGPLTLEDMADFEKMYTKKSEEIKQDKDGFNGAIIDDGHLQIKVNQ